MAKPTIGFLLWQTTHIWQRHITEALKPFDLTHVQYILLAGLVELGQQGKTVTQNALAHYVGIDVMMTSKVSRTLEKKGFILRANNRLDSRAKALVLTKLGVQAVEDARAAIDKVETVLFSSVEQSTHLIDQLTAIQEVAEVYRNL